MAAWLFVGSGVAQTSRPVSKDKTAAAGVELGTRYFGYHLKNLTKVGTEELTWREAKIPGTEVEGLQWERWRRFNEYVDRVHISDSIWFENSAPYGLRHTSFDRHVGGHSDGTVIGRLVEAAKLEFWREGGSRPDRIGSLSEIPRLPGIFGLKAALLAPANLSQAFEVARLDLDRRRVEMERYEVVRVFDQILLGVPQRVTEIKWRTLDADESPLEETLWLDERYRRVASTFSEIESCGVWLEPKRMGMSHKNGVFSPLEGCAVVDRDLGDPKALRRLVLAIPNAVAVELGQHVGQTLKLDDESGWARLEVSAKANAKVAVKDSERRRNERSERRNKSLRPKLSALLLEAGVKAEMGAEDIVAKLIRFVPNHLTLDSRYSRQNLRSILKKRLASSRECSMLFAALAQQAGLVARPVRGFVYGGDRWRGFVVHTWCEVEVKGCWRPVDPTWGEEVLSAGHISAGHLVTREHLLRPNGRTHRTKFKVLKVE